MTLNTQRGYTLIELLVVIVIIMVVTGGSIAGYLKYTNQQTSMVKAQELQKFIRSAQIKARAKEWPAGCVSAGKKVPIIGYRVKSSVLNGVTTISMTGHCANNRGALNTDANPELIDSLVLPSTLLLNSQFEYDFFTLAGGADLHGGSSTVMVKNIADDACAAFTVSDGGSISDVTKVTCP